MFYRALVENISDEKNLQKIQVRVHGIHNFDKGELPTEALPWATAVLPITTGRVDGGGGELDCPDIGDWVWVFYEAHDQFYRYPNYFGIIRGEGDGNPNYIQGENRVSKDRWKNTTFRDSDTQKTADTWGNRTEITEALMKVLDHFDNSISFTEDSITIKSKNGNVAILDSKNNKIEIITPNNASIVMTDNDNIKVSIGTSSIELGQDGNILIGSTLGKNETINFYQFMTLFNTHFHPITIPPGITLNTTPPTIPMNSGMHGFSSVAYAGVIPPNPRIVTKDDPYVAEDDLAGTVYSNEASIDMTKTEVSTDKTVASTALVNGSTNPSTDEYEGTMVIPALAPAYTGTVITTAPAYSNGARLGTKELVKIQGKIVEKKMAQDIYQAIKDSQIYNMIELDLITQAPYKVTEKGALALKKDDGTYYLKDQDFIMSEEYQNFQCPYSLVVVNSGFRGHDADIIDPATNTVICTSQLSMRKRNQTRKMTNEELMTASSKEFSPYTATPGYSKHQNGTAVDFNTRGANQKRWLDSNISKYNFRANTISSEPWHFEYNSI